MTGTDPATIIAETLNALGVVRVIIVDDEIDALSSAAPLLRVRSGIRSARLALAELAAARPELNLADLHDELPDDDELRSRVEECWDQLTAPEQARLIGATPEVESEHLQMMKEHLPPDFDFVPFAVQDWVSDTFVPLLEDGKATLIFFDRNLTHASLGDRGGERLLEQVLAMDLPGVLCGLLTQDVGDLASESQESSALGARTQKAVPVLGKFRLGDAQQFALGMQAFGLASDLQAVRRHVLEAARASFDSGLQTTSDLAYVTLLASARSAHTEGLYEGAGVARMLFTAVRRNVERALVEDLPRDSVDRIRKVMTTSLDLGYPDPAEVGPVHDAFEPADHLIHTMSPTDVGDIYEFTATNGSVSHYILLAQPCDLMVRSSGRRSNSDGYFVLAKLVGTPKGPESSSDASDDAGDSEFEDAPRTLAVGLIPELGGEWRVNLSSRAFMPPELLDACVLTVDGGSTIPGSRAAKELPTIAWALRKDAIDKWGKAKVRRARDAINKLASAGKGTFSDDQKLMLVDLLIRGDLGRQFVDGKVSIDASIDTDQYRLAAGIRRIARLSAPHAKALLLQYSHFHSRPDRPADLLEVIDPPESRTKGPAVKTQPDGRP